MLLDAERTLSEYSVSTGTNDRLGVRSLPPGNLVRARSVQDEVEELRHRCENVLLEFELLSEALKSRSTVEEGEATDPALQVISFVST